jgi:hypothetical protein
LLAQRLADREAIRSGHRNVEQHEIEDVFGSLLERLAAIGCGDDLVAPRLEVGAHILQGFRLVVDDQDPGLLHGRVSPSSSQP